MVKNKNQNRKHREVVIRIWRQRSTIYLTVIICASKELKNKINLVLSLLTKSANH